MSGELIKEMRKLRYSIDNLSKIIEITFGGKTINEQRRKLRLEEVPPVSFSEYLMPSEKKETNPWIEKKKFEYVPAWVKKGGLVNVFYNGRWYKGKIFAMPEDNDRSIEIKTLKFIPETGRCYLSIMVYMSKRSDKDWSELLMPLKE